MSTETDNSGYPANDLLTFEGRTRHDVPEVIHISNLPPAGSPVALAIEKALGQTVEYGLTNLQVFSPWHTLSRPYHAALEGYRSAVRTASGSLRGNSEAQRHQAMVDEARASNDLAIATRSSVEATTLLMNYLKSNGVSRTNATSSSDVGF